MKQSKNQERKKKGKVRKPSQTKVRNIRQQTQNAIVLFPNYVENRQVIVLYLKKENST